MYTGKILLLKVLIKVSSKDYLITIRVHVRVFRSSCIWTPCAGTGTQWYVHLSQEVHVFKRFPSFPLLTSLTNEFLYVQGDQKFSIVMTGVQIVCQLEVSLVQGCSQTGQDF
jgi:hypothetical protein